MAINTVPMLSVSQLKEAIARQHGLVCPATDFYVARGEKLPDIWFSLASIVIVTGSRGEERLRVFMECNDCSKSGYVDIDNDPSLYVKQSAIDKTTLKQPDASSGNQMGGSDVSNDYIS